ncbi:MAG: Rieske 2Fe-2S domain-containing protein [Gammaproteobacteria bacterium]|nr:Rieske 2Fe-2S domain-containing protein [Gammaproteobacteria bacterium]
MEHRMQVAHIERLFDYLDTGTTAMADSVYYNDVATYTCDHQAQTERERLFRGRPIVQCLSCEIPNPGDYHTDDFSGVPILVVRAADGSVNAFLNVCRHRGARVVDGRGNRTRFSCPYHAWTYDQDGALIAIPNDDGFACVDRSQHALTRLPAVEKCGFVWVLPTPGTQEIDLSSSVGELHNELAQYGFDKYHHFETKVLEKRMNWKLVIDTFLETYHLRMLHRNTIHPILYSNLATFEASGNSLRLVAARRSLDAMRGQPKADWDLVKHSAIVYVLFPNTVLIVQGDHINTFRVFPSGDSTDSAKMYVSLYTPQAADTDSARRHWSKNMKLLLDTVEKEDFEVGQKAQIGFYAGAQQHITFGRNEPALAHYHASIREAVAPMSDGVRAR